MAEPDIVTDMIENALKWGRERQRQRTLERRADLARVARGEALRFRPYRPRTHTAPAVKVELTPEQQARAAQYMSDITKRKMLRELRAQTSREMQGVRCYNSNILPHQKMAREGRFDD